MLGMEKSLGAVAPGFFADIVAVQGDPLADITAVTGTENIRWVMKPGLAVRHLEHDVIVRIGLRGHHAELPDRVYRAK